MTTPTDTKPRRLRFIDMARSVAILLMLEGHFVDDSLEVGERPVDYTDNLADIEHHLRARPLGTILDSADDFTGILI